MAKKKYWELPFDVPAWRDSPTRYEMSLAERGLYFEMLAYQWLEGSCPSDAVRLARVCAVSVQEVEALLPTVKPNFREGGDRFVNTKLEDVRTRKSVKEESSRENGRKGGRKPNQKPKAEPNRNQTTNQQLVVSSSVVPSFSLSDLSDDFQATLAVLCDEHPGSFRKQLCEQYLSSLVFDGHKLEDILIAHRDAQKAWKTRNPPDLQNWLSTYSPDNKLVGFDDNKQTKSALAAMDGL